MENEIRRIDETRLMIVKTSIEETVVDKKTLEAQKIALQNQLDEVNRMLEKFTGEIEKEATDGKPL